MTVANFFHFMIFLKMQSFEGDSPMTTVSIDAFLATSGNTEVTFLVDDVSLTPVIDVQPPVISITGKAFKKFNLVQQGLPYTEATQVSIKYKALFFLFRISNVNFICLDRMWLRKISRWFFLGGGGGGGRGGSVACSTKSLLEYSLSLLITIKIFSIAGPT